MPSSTAVGSPRAADGAVGNGLDHVPAGIQHAERSGGRGVRHASGGRQATDDDVPVGERCERGRQSNGARRGRLRDDGKDARRACEGDTSTMLEPVPRWFWALLKFHTSTSPRSSFSVDGHFVGVLVA